MSTVAREQIETLAYQLWVERGRPEGSPADDWERAERLLRFAETSPNETDRNPGEELTAVSPAVVEPSTGVPGSEIVTGAAYIRPRQRNGGSRRT